MSPTPSKRHSIPLEKAEELERLEYSVRRAEEKGNFDTAHHEMLTRLRSELGLIPDKKDTRETKQDEVNDGKSNL
jgi:hypothetical protein